jgi:hypothetical protein
MIRLLGMVAHIYNTSTREERQEDVKFQSSLGYIGRYYLKKKRKKEKKKKKKEGGRREGRVKARESVALQESNIRTKREGLTR